MLLFKLSYKVDQIQQGKKKKKDVKVFAHGTNAGSLVALGKKLKLGAEIYRRMVGNCQKEYTQTHTTVCYKDLTQVYFLIFLPVLIVVAVRKI